MPEREGNTIILVGTRPEIVKMAPLVRAFRKRKIPFNLVHSGQHYDYNMSRRFFDDLELQQPDFSLRIEATTPAVQTGKVMVEVEKIIKATRPRLVLVQGDTNTTLGGAIAARKSNVKVGHVEAGLRSYDLRMQEEHNRRIVDHISSYLFAPTELCRKNLLHESVWGRAFVTGNTAIDACVQHLRIALRRSKILKTLRFKRYALATVHRAENVDSPNVLRNIVESMMEAPIPVVVPVHPRTEKMLKENDLWGEFSTHKNVQVLPPVGYIDFLALMKSSTIIMTDSGGVQEEATSPAMRKLVLVLRLSTERVEAVRDGFARVVGTEKHRILADLQSALIEKTKLPRSSPYGDGNAAKRIVEILRAQEDL